MIEQEGKIRKIAVTGGPCAGKTTLMAKAIEDFTNKGVTVFVAPEAATTLIAGMHISPGDFGMEQFQEFVIWQQYCAEEIVMDAAHKLAKAGQDVLVLCDRGKLDNLAYANETVIDAILETHGSNMIQARDDYDAVIHLVTAANGAEAFYTLDNNEARKEPLELARELDAKTLKAWTGHPHLSIIGNEGTFQQKIDRALCAIYECLGLPAPLERERKFLVWMPDLTQLAVYNPVKSVIVQTYLPSDGDTERRVRQRGDGKHFSYFYTEKRDMPQITDRAEVESPISPELYLQYLARVDYSKTVPIRKDRHCFPYERQYIELDIYMGESMYAIVEVEGCDKDAPILFPPEIQIVREVTGDKRFSNHSIAENGGKLPEIEF